MVVKKTKKTTSTKVKPEAAEVRQEKQREESDDETYEIEKILDKRETRSEGLKYYVKWKNYPSQYNTWEPLENLEHTTMVDEFESKLKSKSKRTAKVETETMEEDEQEKEDEEEEAEESENVEQAKPKSEETQRPKRMKTAIRLTTNKTVPVKTKAVKATTSTSEDKTEDKPEGKPGDKSEDKLELQSEVKPQPVKEPEAKSGILKKTTAKRAARGAKKPITTDEVPLESPQESPPPPSDATETASVSDVLDFQKFKPVRVIDESLESKSITFFGKYNGEDAVIKLEKMVFEEIPTRKALADKELQSDRTFVNDIYSSYVVTPDLSHLLNNIKATVICPADSTVLAKYSKTEKILYTETPAVYSHIVKPYIDEKLAREDPNRWVYNILEGKSEADRVIMNDPDPDSGFMMVQDLKHSGGDKEVILLAICHRRDIRSLRDLNEKHTTLLKNILTKGTQAIKEKYKRNTNELVDPADYKSTDRDHLLSTIINNMTISKFYYKKTILTYPLSTSSDLYKRIKEVEPF